MMTKTKQNERIGVIRRDKDMELLSASSFFRLLSEEAVIKIYIKLIPRFVFFIKL